MGVFLRPESVKNTLTGAEGKFLLLFSFARNWNCTSKSNEPHIWMLLECTVVLPVPLGKRKSQSWFRPKRWPWSRDCSGWAVDVRCAQLCKLWWVNLFIQHFKFQADMSFHGQWLSLSYVIKSRFYLILSPQIWVQLFFIIIVRIIAIPIKILLPFDPRIACW